MKFNGDDDFALGRCGVGVIRLVDQLLGAAVFVDYCRSMVGLSPLSVLFRPALSLLSQRMCLAYRHQLLVAVGHIDIDNSVLRSTNFGGRGERVLIAGLKIVGAKVDGGDGRADMNSHRVIPCCVDKSAIGPPCHWPESARRSNSGLIGMDITNVCVS